MRYRAVKNNVENDNREIIATIVGHNQDMGRKLARICAEQLNVEAREAEWKTVQAKIAKIERVDDVLADIEARFEGCAV